jgi:MoxR-like ATPase
VPENKFRGGGMVINDEVADAVNAALILRRPLLVTGKPGIGKSSLAYAIAYRLALGRVLVWPITSRSTLKQGLYEYDAVARLENASRRYYERAVSPPLAVKEPTQRPPVDDGNADDIGKYIRLGPVGTALLPADLPRVLLIDEIDKSDVDLPNDLLHVFEEGRFRIDELARLPEEKRFETVKVFPHDSNARVPVPRDWVQCRAFPVAVLTSNGEREFPPAFNRRCVRLTIPEPNAEQLADIVASRLYPRADGQPGKEGKDLPPEVNELVNYFWKLRDTPGPDGSKRELAVDQLLNAVHLLLGKYLPADRPGLRDLVLKSLTDAGAEETK